MKLLQFVSLAVILLPVLLLGGCQTADNLLFEPAVTDPLDGYEGNLAQAGINTEMDYGPKQNLLLSRYKTLLESNASMQKRLDDVLAENQNLQSQLTDESGTLQRERALRAQAEAETEQLRQRRRDLEARILSLSIEKAKLEQSQLLSKIEALQQSMEAVEAAPVEAAAQPMRGR